jgi:hypothetical protein
MGGVQFLFIIEVDSLSASMHIYSLSLSLSLISLPAWALKHRYIGSQIFALFTTFSANDLF